MKLILYHVTMSEMFYGRRALFEYGMGYEE